MASSARRGPACTEASRPAKRAVAEAGRRGAIRGASSMKGSGPAGGAGDFKAVREIIAVLSILLPRERVTPEVVLESY